MNLKHIIGMDLDDALKEIKDKKTPLKVGAKYGTAFFYCGTVGDFEKHIDEISDKEYKKICKAYEHTKSELEGVVRRFPRIRNRIPDYKLSLTAWIEAAKGYAKDFDEYYTNGTLDFLCDCGKWAQKVKDNRYTLENAEKKVQGFMPLRTRGVMEAFYTAPAADSACPLVLIISGYEIGDYWTVEESNEKRD